VQVAGCDWWFIVSDISYMFGITLFQTPTSFLMRNYVMPVSEPVRGCEQDKWIFKSITILLLRLYLRVVYFYITVYCKVRDIKRLQLWIFPFRFYSQPDDGCILAETRSWWCLINSLLCLGGTYCTFDQIPGLTVSWTSPCTDWVIPIPINRCWSWWLVDLAS
jgi:hypothetical protein